MIKLSSEQLAVFKDCPLRFNYERQGIKGIRIDNPARDYEQAVKTAIAEFYNSLNEDTLDGISSHARTVLGRCVLPEGYEEIHRDVTSSFVRGEEKRYASLIDYLPVLVDGLLDSGSLSARVDYYNESSKTVILWRASRAAGIRDGDRVKGTLIRNLLLSQGKPVEKVVFSFLVVDKTVELPLTSYEWMQKMIVSVYEAIEKDEFPASGTECAFCEYQLDCTLRENCLWETLL